LDAGSPACAGIDRLMRSLRISRLRFPRVRGDRPLLRDIL